MRDTFAMTMWGIDDERFVALAMPLSSVMYRPLELRDEFLAYYNRNCKNELFINRFGHVSYRFD